MCSWVKLALITRGRVVLRHWKSKERGSFNEWRDSHGFLWAAYPQLLIIWMYSGIYGLHIWEKYVEMIVKATDSHVSHLYSLYMCIIGYGWWRNMASHTLEMWILLVLCLFLFLITFLLFYYVFEYWKTLRSLNYWAKTTEGYILDFGLSAAFTQIHTKIWLDSLG